MNEDQKNYYTFSFYVDPDLNAGYTEVFKQGNEPWWWYVKDGVMGAAAGPTPDFEGATFKSMSQWNEKLL